MRYQDLREYSGLVRLLDGRTGRVIAWNHRAQAIVVHVGENDSRQLHCSRVELDAAGLIEIEPD